MTGREAALAALERCRRDGAWSSAVLDRLRETEKLDRREAALAERLALSVLQNDRFCDYIIGCFCSTKPEKLESRLLDLLRLGTVQILFFDKIPDRAAVDESVRLCREIRLERAAGLVNAVLRRVAENRESLPAVRAADECERLAIRYSHPTWLVRRLCEQRGEAFTEAFLAANNESAPIDLQINTLKISVENYTALLEEKKLAYRLPAFPSGCVELPGGSVSQLPGYEEGFFYVQDRAAAAAAEIAEPKSGMRVLDACAAPGGKTFAAAIRMRGEGSVLARDIHEKKLRLVRAGAERLGLAGIETEAGDARAAGREHPGEFDLVIADVPCSGFGVIRKKPEIRRRSEKDAAALPALQAEILDSLSGCVRPGGTLLYATCTVLREENEDQIAAFLRRHPEFVPEDFSLGGMQSENGCYTFWPHIDGTDGFFAARLRRKEP